MSIDLPLLADDPTPPATGRAKLYAKGDLAYLRTASGVVKLLLTNEQLNGRVDGARLAWVSVSSVSVGDTGDASQVIDSTRQHLITWTGLLTAAITASGVNGLDTGSEASNTWYAVHVIGDTTGAKAPASLLSTSATAPTLPAGYDVFRRVGWVRNNGSSDFFNFYQVGDGRNRWVYWFNHVAGDFEILTSGAATTFTTVSAAAFVPPTSRLFEFTGEGYNGGQTGNDVGFRHPDENVSSDPFDYLSDKQWGFEHQTFARWRDVLYCNTSQQIQYRWEVATGSPTLDMQVRAWLDEL